MSLFGHKPTFKESIQQLEERPGIPRYANLIAEIFSGSTEDSGSLSESEFMKQFVDPIDPIDEDITRALEFIPQSCRTIFSLIDWLLQTEKPSEICQHASVLAAVHIELFRRQYLVGEKMLTLFSYLLDQSDYEDEDDYLNYLKTKHGLSDAELDALKFKWVITYSQVLQGVIEDDLHIAVFHGNPICFKVRNLKKESALGVPQLFRTDNDIIISKYFFLSWVVEDLCLLELLTKIVAAENGCYYDKSSMDIDEIYVIDNILCIAKELLERMEKFNYCLH